MINRIIAPLAQYLPENNTIERIWVLAKLDFKSRYYFHKLGILWALVRPVFELLVYYTVFTIIFENDIPYFDLYLFSGLLVWYLFVEGTSKGINVLMNKRYLIESIQFRKIELIASTTLSAFLAFCFNFMAYIFISLVRGHPTLNLGLIQFLPLLILTLIMIMGFALILASLSIYFKDIQHVWDMITMAGFWITPIVYSDVIMIEKMPSMIFLNPMAAIVINMHRTLLNSMGLDFNLLLISTIYSIVVLVIGLLMFHKMSDKAAEKY